MSNLRQRRVLVVDDDPDLLDVLADRLRLMRFEVECADDGRDHLPLPGSPELPTTRDPGRDRPFPRPGSLLTFLAPRTVPPHIRTRTQSPFRYLTRRAFRIS